MLRKILFILLSVFYLNVDAKTILVGKDQQIRTVREALQLAEHHDTILVHAGTYKEGNLIIRKSICLLGEGRPVLDGERKFEVVSVKAQDVTVSGFKICNSGYATLNDPCGIKVYDSYHVTISDNILENNFFGIYLQYSKNCIIKNNRVSASNTEEQEIGNGIHCWNSDSLQIIGNRITGHRDGIYFEFVTNSVIWRNISHNNLRYGLHFMFSNSDSYIGNVFKGNGAGVAVMFSHRVTMIHNTFEENWGDAAYGLLLKEISDSYILGNCFLRNTSGIYMEGTSRIRVEKNIFRANGWGMKIQASCMENEITENNFQNNTFDVSTNGSLVLNTFNNNYWDKYEGYDLNRNNIGDVPYHPLSVFSVIVEKNPPAMLLFRSFMVTLLDKSEKLMPSITPDNFVDQAPAMHAYML